MRSLKQWNMRSVLFGLAGLGLLLVGLASGLALGGAFSGRAAAQAQGNAQGNAQAGVVTTNSTSNLASKAMSADSAKYCRIYESALAQQLKIDQSTLESANVVAIKATLAQMAADGQITQTEETQMAAFASQLGANPCAQLTSHSALGALAGNSQLTAQFLAARSALLDSTAKALGITSAALSSDLANGQTVSAVAVAQHVDLKRVENAYTSAANTFLAQAVSTGVITSAQKDEISTMLQKSVGQGHFPLLDGGMAGVAGMMGGQ